MKISSMDIYNFKSIAKMEIKDIDYAFILVGKNSTGKSAVLDGIRAILGNYDIAKKDFKEENKNVEISINLEISDSALDQMNEWGLVLRKEIL